jgi:serine/threonine protein kinase
VAGTPKSSLSGTTLDGRYELLEPIGSGGVGDVYRARLLKLDRLVAVKVLHEALITNANFVDRFQREARAISRMHHPHCVAVLDFGVLESRPYLVLEYLPGQTVTSLLEAGPFAPARAVGIALQLLDTLSYFHGQSVIHRDLKSENLMLVASGASGAIKDFLKVLDFGMAKIVDTEGDDSQLNQLGLVAGTVSAMAPEQLQQARPDNRIDIYATGILLFEMIVGRRPFRASDPAVVARMQLETAPPRPRDILGEAGPVRRAGSHHLAGAGEEPRQPVRQRRADGRGAPAHAGGPGDARGAGGQPAGTGTGQHRGAATGDPERAPAGHRRAAPREDSHACAARPAVAAEAAVARRRRGGLRGRLARGGESLIAPHRTLGVTRASPDRGTGPGTGACRFGHGHAAAGARPPRGDARARTGPGRDHGPLDRAPGPGDRVREPR